MHSLVRLNSILEDLVEFGDISISTAKKVIRGLNEQSGGTPLERPPIAESAGYVHSGLIGPDPSIRSLVQQRYGVAPNVKSIVVPRKSILSIPNVTTKPLYARLHESGHSADPLFERDVESTPKIIAAGQAAVERGDLPEARRHSTEVLSRVLGSEQRANKGVLEQIAKHGTGAEAESWKKFANLQMRVGYRKPYFDELRHGITTVSAGKAVLKQIPLLRRKNINLAALLTKLDGLIQFKLYQPEPEDEPPDQLPIFDHGELVDYTVQRHEAKRAGSHRDVRIGNPRHGLLSWATRKEHPEPGKNIAIHQQPTHPHSYLGWEGDIPSGYGAGKVSTEHVGKALVTHSSPDELHATLASQRGTQRVAFIRHPKGWLMAHGKHPEAPPEAQKPKMESIGPGNRRAVLKRLTEEVEKGAIVQPKVDGALAYIKVGPRPEILSHRTSKTTGKNVVHTERFYHHRPTLDIPEEHHGKTLLAEVYGERDGRAIEPQELGGILNANIAESIHRQKTTGVTLKAMPFDVAGEEGTYPERLEKLKDIAQHLPQIELPEEAHTPEEAHQLYDDIRSGDHPLTKEGVIIHRPDQRPIKVKNFKETNVKIHSTFPGEGKYEGSHGGFYYADKHGEPLGKVGTGFTDQTRQDLPQYVGRKARVRYQERYKSGRLRAPSFIGVDENK